MTVLVTGAAGFLGSHVFDLLQEMGERPRAFVRPTDDISALEVDDVDVFRGDIADGAALQEALIGVDRVFHCAARTGPWGAETEYVRTNVVGLEMLVRSAMAAGVRRVVHVSSITVHGNDMRGTADENAALREEPNPYSRSKVAGERLLLRMIRDERAPVTIVRPGWIYGPGDRSSFARIAGLIASRRMTMIGSGNNHLPLIYVTDVARGIVRAGDGPPAEGACYLLVNDEPVTQREFVTAIAAGLGVPPPKRRIPYELALMLGTLAETLGRVAGRSQPPPVMRYGIQLLGGENRFVIARARRELAFLPVVDLTEGIERSIDWYRTTYRVAAGSVRP